MSKFNNPQNQPQKPKLIGQASFYQGIIPQPQDLAQYEQISPGFAARIIKMTEDESNHRRKIERRVVTWAYVSQILGQFLAMVAVLVVCYLCYFALDRGFATQAATIAIGVLIGLASVFRYKNKQPPQKGG